MPTVRPTTAPDPLRTTLVDAAAKLIAAEGTTAPTLRRVADEAGTSTMAIYTHFGGMAELRRAVRWEGFRRLAADLAEVDDGDDPLVHVVGLCLTYCRNAIANPGLYRVMFMEEALDDEDAAVCAGTFEVLIGALAACVEAGRLAPADPVELATRLWVAGHGIVTLQLARALPEAVAEATVPRILTDLLTAYGAEPAAIGRALQNAVPRGNDPDGEQDR
jgi:AcrR family transcriptional regulator